MRTPLIMGAIWLALAAPAAAQAPAQVVVVDPQPSRQQHLELAGRYLELTQGGEVFKQLRAQLDETYGQMDLPEEQRVWMASQLADAVQEAVEVALVELRDDVADAFTVAELEGAIAFYGSPTGRAVVRKQSELNFEMQQVMAPLLLERLGGLMEKFCQRFDCEGLAEAVAKSGR